MRLWRRVRRLCRRCMHVCMRACTSQEEKSRVEQQMLLRDRQHMNSRMRIVIASRMHEVTVSKYYMHPHSTVP